MGLDRRLISTDGFGADGEPITQDVPVPPELLDPQYTAHQRVLSRTRRRVRQVEGSPRLPDDRGATAVRSHEVPVRDLLAVVLTAAGVVLVATGAFLALSVGYALLVVGGTLLLLGVLLGLR